MNHAGDVDPSLYDELRVLAAHYMGRERSDHTLQPTALAHEAWIRLGGGAIDGSAERRRAFLAAAARAFRQILVDHARRRGAAKHGGGWRRIALSDELDLVEDGTIDILHLDDALARLAELNERQARIVELRFFGGLSVEETAASLGVSRRTVLGDWRMARAWLFGQIENRGRD